MNLTDVTSAVEHLDTSCEHCEGKKIAEPLRTDRCRKHHADAARLRDFIKEHENCSVMLSKNLIDVLAAVRSKAADAEGR